MSVIILSTVLCMSLVANIWLVGLLLEAQEEKKKLETVLGAYSRGMRVCIKRIKKGEGK